MFHLEQKHSNFVLGNLFQSQLFSTDTMTTPKIVHLSDKAKTPSTGGMQAWEQGAPKRAHLFSDNGRVQSFKAEVSAGPW